MKGGNIAADHGNASQHGELSNANELMDANITGNDCLGPDLHVTAEQGTADECYFIRQNAVVGHVGTGHQVAVVADDRGRLFDAGTVDGDGLADQAALSNAAVADRPGIFSILGRISDDGVGMNLTIGADVGIPHDDHGRSQATVGADAHRALNDDVGADVTRRVDDGIRMDISSWMDAHENPHFRPTAHSTAAVRENGVCQKRNAVHCLTMKMRNSALTQFSK